MCIEPRPNAYVIKKYLDELRASKIRTNGARMCEMVSETGGQLFYTIKQRATHAGVTEIVYRAQVYINIP